VAHYVALLSIGNPEEPLLSCCRERTRRLARDAWLTTAGVLLPMAYWVYYLSVE